MTRLPESGVRARGQSMPSVQHTPPTFTNNRPHKIITTTANTTTNRSNRSSYVMHGHLQRSFAFINGQPSPPMEPDEVPNGIIDNSEVLREMPSVSTLSLGGDSTWFRDDRDDLSDMSDNVQQLIRETDEAFKAVSTALADARFEPHSPGPFFDNNNPPLQHLQHLQQASRPSHDEPALMARHSPTSTMEIATVSPMSPTRSAGRGAIASCGNARKRSSSDIVKSSINGISIANSKKGSTSKSPTAKAMAHESSPLKSAHGTASRASGGYRPHHSYHKSMSRLNLAADKVTDKLFDGRNGRFGFLKIEADEVVTPDQVDLFRRNRLAKQAARAAAKRKAVGATRDTFADEVGDETSSDTDIEPMRPQDLPSFGHSSILSPVMEVATPDLFEFNRGITGQSPSAEATKEVRIGQNPLATPPPSPPHYPCDTAQTQTSASANTEDDESTLVKGLGVSKFSNRRLAHKRSTSSTSHIASLPTIPEVKSDGPPVWDASRLNQQLQRQNPDQNGRRPETPNHANDSPYFEEDDEHMFFMCSPITATAPGLQHGRIRLAKADLVNAGTINSLESKMWTSPDETLDWTAFQMAILGAGDLFNDPENFSSRDAQEEMVDDLCDWIEDLGFTSGDLGALERSGQPKAAKSSRPSRTRQTASMTTPASVSRASRTNYYRKHAATKSNSTDSSTSSASSGLTRSGDSPDLSPDHSIPITLESEHPSGFWNSSSSGSDRFRGGPGLKRWTLEGHPKRYQGSSIDVGKANAGVAVGGGGMDMPRTPGSNWSETAPGRASVASLPQSPMLELRMMTGVDGNTEFVSMGYNLNHDLGDFLKWEAEHVYASGFYGAD